VPLRDGAARLGVPVVVVVVRSFQETFAWEAGGCSCFHSFGPSNATTPRNTTPRTAARIFCFFCFAFRLSTRLFALYVAPVADALLEGVVVVSPVVVVVVDGGVAAGAPPGAPGEAKAAVPRGRPGFG